VRILLVSATDAEIAPFLGALRDASPHDIEVLTTGVGMVATAVWCARALSRTHYDVALNLGVCGSFDPALPPGSVVHVVADQMPELGAEDGEAFLTIQQMGLLGDDEFPYRGKQIVNGTPPQSSALHRLPGVTGITVNTVHGDPQSIAAVTSRFAPQVESMEGAAFMYACRVSDVPYAQVRAVSNMVERRNREAWKIGDALRHLGAAAAEIVATL
jgi:futalosine hydrolase